MIPQISGRICENLSNVCFTSKLISFFNTNPLVKATLSIINWWFTSMFRHLAMQHMLPYVSPFIFRKNSVNASFFPIPASLFSQFSAMKRSQFRVWWELNGCASHIKINHNVVIEVEQQSNQLNILRT